MASPPEIRPFISGIFMEVRKISIVPKARVDSPSLSCPLSCPFLDEALEDHPRYPRTSRWLITMVRFCPLRIGLWDPFQMAFLWFVNASYTNWDDPPSRESVAFWWGGAPFRFSGHWFIRWSPSRLGPTRPVRPPHLLLHPLVLRRIRGSRHVTWAWQKKLEEQWNTKSVRYKVADLSPILYIFGKQAATDGTYGSKYYWFQGFGGLI